MQAIIAVSRAAVAIVFLELRIPTDIRNKVMPVKTVVKFNYYFSIGFLILLQLYL